MDSHVKSIKASEDTGIKYIPGCEFYVVDSVEKFKSAKGKDLKRTHLTAFALSSGGVANLFKLLTVANLEINFYRRPLLDWKILMDEDVSDIYFGTACTSGMAMRDDYKEIIKFFISSISDKLFAEVMPHVYKDQIIANKNSLVISKKYNLPIIATNDNHYVNKGDEYYQEMLLAMQSKAKWSDPKRWKFDFAGLYMRTREEMTEEFLKQAVFNRRQINSALDNACIISDSCNIIFSKQSVKLPVVYSDGRSDTDSFIDIVFEGFEKKITNNKKILDADYQKYCDRIEEEAGLIKELKFERYFILVYDFIKWAKKSDILVGPGRGSAGGSLVSYCLDITTVDPIEYDLLFARFISPARIDLPDIDLDFEDAKRYKIREYLEKKYGKDCVSAVSTFSEMHGRGALRDVARVYEVPLADVNKAAKSIVVRGGGDVREDFSIKDAFEVFEEGKIFMEKYPKVSKTAMAMEGVMKNSGIHAAGLVVSSAPLTSGEQGYISNRKSTFAINWDKEDLEYMGLMKLDILGLNILTVLSKCSEFVVNKGGKPIDFYLIDDFADKKIISEFNVGNTVGVFQFESYGIRKLCSESGVSSFKDLYDINALFRPGALRSGMVTDYVNRKHGKETKRFVHREIEELTKDTHGIILYQEQIMNLLYNLGGLTWKTTDMVRKVVSKAKGVEQFQKFKDLFVKGCIKRTDLSEEEAGNIFDEMKHFGCLTGDTILYKASSNQYSGREVTVKSLYEYQKTSNFKFRKMKIHSMCDDGVVRLNTVNCVVYTGKKAVYEIITEKGKKITATENHKFLAGDDWKAVKDLTEEDYLICTDFKKQEKNYKTTGTGSGAHNVWHGKYLERNKKRNILKNKIKECQLCCSKKYLEIHHKDKNIYNNIWKNLIVVCRKCHRKLHNEIDPSVYSRFKRGLIANSEKIVNIKFVGIKNTYDVEMIGEPRNFIANGIVTHNSYGFNKCVSSDTKILVSCGKGSKSKKRITIKQAYIDKSEFIFSYDTKTKKLFKASIKEIVRCGKRKVFELVCRNNRIRKIKATEDHKFLTENMEWKALKDLRIGDKVCIKKESISVVSENPFDCVAIEGIYDAGYEETYDIHVDHHCHNYLANLFVVHNSHSVEYSVIAWWCMFCKVYYPIEYMQALLSYTTKDKDRYQFYIDEALRLGMDIELADINFSDSERWIYHKDKTYIPFKAIKNIGDKAAFEIIMCRGNKTYKNEDDFLKRTNKRIVNSRVRSFLKRAGVFRCFSDDDLDDVAASKQYSFTWLKDEQYETWDKFIKDSYAVGVLGEKGAKDQWYFGLMTELKFGYHQKVKNQSEKLKDIKGTSESLGGAYGYMRSVDGGYGMVTFDSKLYASMKYDIEHCASKYSLLRGKTATFSNNIVADKLYTEESFLKCNIPLDVYDAKKVDYDFSGVDGCRLCPLHNEAIAAVCTEYNSNVVVLGEAPGRTENKKGRSFWGEAGNKLFDTLNDFGLERDDVTLANCCKCYPSKTKTPTDKQIGVCTDNHLIKELKAINPIIILALGNTSLKFVKDESSGIRDLSGKTIWNNKLNCWICYCVHPASVLYNEKENGEIFTKSIGNFVSKVSMISG